MRKLIIIKLGSTFPELASSHGDFENWIASPLASYLARIEVVNPCTGDPLPGTDSLAGVIITGSHSMVTDRHDWSELVAKWIPTLVSTETPLLGICYGHQLLAHAMGGSVADNPNGREFGTCMIELTEEATGDPLLGPCYPALEANLCHTQSVMDLPPGATRLAMSSRDPNQSYRIGRAAWGVQFHPEFDSVAMEAYIRGCSDLLAAEGQDVATLLDGVKETPDGSGILRRFADICFETDQP